MDDTIIYFSDKQFKQYYQNKNYYISQDGEVYSAFSRNLIKILFRNSGGKTYPIVDMYINGKEKHMPVHRLVYETWVGPIRQGEQINHINDNPMDNRIENLYAGSQKQNIADCQRNRHRVGNLFYLTLYDKKENKTITFCPASEFIQYSGHPCQNGGINRMFSRNWFKKRYEIVEFRRIRNYKELYYEGVTTNPDECRDVGRDLPPVEAHRMQESA